MKHNLLAHSDFMEIAEQRGYKPDILNNSAPDFGTWFWHGGFVIVISYIIIAIGTVLCVKWLFEEIRCKIKKK